MTQLLLLIVSEITDIDLVKCPDFIAEDPILYLNQFLTWKKKRGLLCYVTEDFVDWMNQYLLKESKEKVTYLKRNFMPSEEELKYQTLNL